MLRTKDKALHLGERLRDVIPFHKASRYSQVGDLSASSRGTTVTSNASANTKSTDWVEIVASTPVDADGFFLQIEALTALRDFLLDIAVGGAGSESIILPDLQFSSGTGSSSWADIYVPIPVAAGSRLSAKCQSSTGSSNLGICISLAYGDPYRAMRCQRATAYGAATSDSGGVALDPGGVAHTKPASFTQITASTTNPIRYMIVSFGNRANTAYGVFTQWLIDVATGASSSEVVVLDDLQVFADTTSDHTQPSMIGRWLEVPAGTRLSAKAQCSNTDATDRQVDISIIGFD